MTNSFPIKFLWKCIYFFKSHLFHMESFFERVKNLSLRILQCPNVHAENCLVQDFYGISIYPDMVYFGSKFETLLDNRTKENIPRVIFIGDEPKQDNDNLLDYRCDGGNYFSFLLQLQHNKMIDNIKNDTSIDKSNITDILFKKIYNNYEKAELKLKQNWFIDGYPNFPHFKAKRDYNHQLIWKLFFELELPNPWEYEVNTNLTLCGCPVKTSITYNKKTQNYETKYNYPKPNEKMRSECIKQGFLEELLKIAKPEIIFCFGSLSWAWFDNFNEYCNTIDYNMIDNSDGLNGFKKVKINSENCLLVRIPHFSYYASNDRVFSNIIKNTKDSSLISVIKFISERFKSKYQNWINL